MFACPKAADKIIMHYSLICSFDNSSLLLSTCYVEDTMLDVSRTMLKKSDMVPSSVELMILWGKESKQNMEQLQPPVSSLQL